MWCFSLFGVFFLGGESDEVNLFVFSEYIPCFCDYQGLHCKQQLVENLLNKSKMTEDKGCRKKHLFHHNKIIIKVWEK